MVNIATADRVSREQLLDFVRTRHRHTLVTFRRDGRPQLSPVAGGVDGEGRIVVSTYPDRAKARNLRRDPRVSVPSAASPASTPTGTSTAPRCDGRGSR